MNDLNTFLLRTLGGFLALIAVFLIMLFLFGCGFDLACYRAQTLSAEPKTPVPTLIPATRPAANPVATEAFPKCQVRALDLIGAWVEAGYSETEPFPFTDQNGVACQGTFQKDIFPLLNENHIWYPASLACTSCHNAALKKGTGGLDLSSYAGILAGSKRETPEQAQGIDILGGGNWKNSILYQSLTLTENIPDGHPLAGAAQALVIYAGTPAASTP